MPNIGLPDTATVPELLWTGIGLLALLANLWLLYDNVRDTRALAASGRNGARRIVAHTAAVVQLGLAAPQAVAVLLGAIALLNGPSAPGQPPSRATAIVIAGLILNQIIALATALYSRWRRVHLIAYLDAREDREGEVGRRLRQIDNRTADTNAVVHAIDERIAAGAARDEARLDRAEAREERRDERAGEAAEDAATALQRTDDRRDERERNLH